ncbi:hypothetical protein D3C79_1040750 [compost metagenome]
MDRIDDRHIFELIRNAFDGAEDITVRLALRLAAVCRHQDQSFSLRPLEYGMGVILLYSILKHVCYSIACDKYHGL